MSAAEIIPLNQPEPSPGEWQALEVVVPGRLPRIPPGDYQAVSVGLKRYKLFTRWVLRLDFDVYDGEVVNGALLARVPYYMRAEGKRPAATSKLGRLLHTAKVESKRGRSVNLSVLARKLWRVRVGDAKRDSSLQPLTEQTTYSVVEQVLERLA